MIKNRNVDPYAEIEARKLAGTNKNNADLSFETFNTIPIALTKASGGGAATGADGDENLLQVGNNTFEYHCIEIQTILSPVQAAAGLDIGMDQTEDDGVELTQGITAASKHAFTVGTDAAFYFKVKLNIANVSGTDDCAIGFRKAEGYIKTIDSYDEMACLNVIIGAVTIETILNNAATDSQATGNAVGDGEDVTLTVRVSAAGVVTFEVDNADPPTTAAFTFDDGEVVVPFLFFLHAAAPVAGAVVVKEWECGYQADEFVSI